VTAVGEVGTVRRTIEATVRAPAGLEASVVAWRPIADDQEPDQDEVWSAS
jgi:hypothetical protein